MKKRVYMLMNFFAFNLLFFALYLNFIHKDAAAAVPSTPSKVTSVQIAPASTSNSVEEQSDLQNKSDKAASLKNSETPKPSMN